MGAGGDDLQQSYTRVPRSSALSKPFSNIISSEKPNFLAVSLPAALRAATFVSLASRADPFLMFIYF